MKKGLSLKHKVAITAVIFMGILTAAIAAIGYKLYVDSVMESYIDYADTRSIGGLGIYMVKKSMDDVRYEYKDGQNVLTITKNLTCGQRQRRLRPLYFRGRRRGTGYGRMVGGAVFDHAGAVPLDRYPAGGDRGNGFLLPDAGRGFYGQERKRPAAAHELPGPEGASENIRLAWAAASSRSPAAAIISWCGT